MSKVLDDTSDTELVGACVAGDRGAFDTLVRRHQRHVYQLCYRFVGNHEDASELAQDTFVRAYRALSSFKGDAAFGTWIHRIGVNLCLNRVSRKTPQNEPLADVDRTPAAGEGAEAAVIRQERAARVRAAIAQLPDKQRATLILRTYQDLSHEEIAKVLGSTVGAAKTNLFHALRRLREILTDDQT